MCFTVNVNITREELEKRYNTAFIDHENYRPSYYYHAGSLPELPVTGFFGDEYNIRMLKWGLIPGWAEGEEEAQKIRYMTFNARAETLAKKPSFKEPFRRSRCIIPVRGFYEWQRTGGKKIPWYIYPSQPGIMMLAGLYDSWRNPADGKDILTFTIITTRANKLLSEIHNTKKRMPVILHDGDLEKWIDYKSDEAEIDTIFEPFPDDALKAHTIGPLITKQKINRNTPALIKEYKYPGQSMLF
ncbi:MAG: SOS response-associated peptidase [Bacteroidales bacterium]|nr:SOS response-associated peptidase [Bacteroidales bacterium]